MTIHYENTLEDAREFYACWLKRTRSGKAYFKQVRLGRIFSLMLLALGELWLLKAELPLLAEAIIVLLAGIIGYLATTFGSKRMVRQVTEQQRKTGSLDLLLGQKEISISRSLWR